MEESQGQEAPKMSSVDSEHEEFEMTHTDKLVGVFSEPSSTFERISKFPLKNSDWLIPLLVALVVTILTVIVKFSNPEVKLEARQQSEKQIQKMVEDGKLSQEQANQSIEMSEKFSSGPFFYVSTSVTIVIGGFIFFFIISGVYFLCAKLILKGDGTYKDAMLAYGMPHYIVVIQLIITTILALVMGKMVNSTSLAEFITVDKKSFVHFILGKLDVFTIWFYVVVGIAFAKLFKSNDIKKYIILIIGLWIGFSLLFFVLSKSIPFLERFSG